MKIKNLEVVKSLIGSVEIYISRDLKEEKWKNKLLLKIEEDLYSISELGGASIWIDMGETLAQGGTPEIIDIDIIEDRGERGLIFKYFQQPDYEYIQYLNLTRTDIYSLDQIELELELEKKEVSTHG